MHAGYSREQNFEISKYKKDHVNEFNTHTEIEEMDACRNSGAVLIKIVWCLHRLMTILFPCAL